MLQIKPVLHVEGLLPVDSVIRPTTVELIHICPRVRILVVGKSGVGKSSLISRIFGVETASAANVGPGVADIEQEFTSPQNDRLVLHDSRGFELGDGGNYEIVKSFIEKRKKMPDIKDQLHVVWMCFQIPIPTFGERLLEDAEESFLQIRNDVLGNTLAIVVFTKHDRLVSFMRQKMPNHPGAVLRHLQEDCIQPIQEFTGDKNIAHVTVSSKLKQEYGLEELIRLTQEQVSKSFTSPENQVLAVPLAAAGAQRMLPTLKVDLSIGVGKQRYWRALGTSANFPGYTMQDCLLVIHIDVVSVWNFYDPFLYLYSKEFRNFMMNMVEKVDAPAESNPPLPRNDTFSEGGTPRGPVNLPLNAFVALGEWVNATYQPMQSVHTKFMAYIVDLTNVLGILFSLMASIRAKKLTRTAIKLTCMAYYESEWMTDTHMEIRHFEGSNTTRDAILEKVISMISDDREVQVSRAVERMPRVDLDRDEEWTDS
ncbi:hypothetical protein EDC04DRAFT_2907343 [Pisolithus marmoratus]|nr:hypothetical protein EDC04DRAFT_2907343 [Pisolithus marmoratus]